MTAETTSTAGGASKVAALQGRCPHLLFHNVLGPETVGALMDYVVAREPDFTPAKVGSRRSGGRIDRIVKDGFCLGDLGPFRGPFTALLNRVAAQALRQLGLFEPAAEPSEFEIGAYGDGGHYALHPDTFETHDRVRILSCVYYFAGTPRRFTGGILRLYGFPTSATNGIQPQTVDIVPETDSLIIFPSWLPHAVLPVQVASGAWADGRFTITCWMHRADSPMGAASQVR